MDFFLGAPVQSYENAISLCHYQDLQMSQNFGNIYKNTCLWFRLQFKIYTYERIRQGPVTDIRDRLLVTVAIKFITV